MKFENTEVFNFEGATRGMRNPLESWHKNDTFVDEKEVFIGKNDLELMQKLIKAGSEHRKFLRQIFVSCDITAPLYWWKEFDTYKVGTVANSTSTMHKLASTPITKDCFEMNDLLFENTIWLLECCRQDYLKTKDKTDWKKLIVNLPESWLQTRTVTMNYENLLSMYNQRCICPHKLNEWSGKDNPDVPNFKSWVESLPYAKELICIKKEK